MGKSRITFKIPDENNPTRVNIYRDGQLVGDIWSESGSDNFPDTGNDCSLQMCGFEKLKGEWGCTRFPGRDLIVSFAHEEEKPCCKCECHQEKE